MFGNNKIMSLYYFRGQLVKLVETRLGNESYDIAVARSGDLISTDGKDKTVNIVKNTKIKTLIRLQEWKF